MFIPLVLNELKWAKILAKFSVNLLYTWIFEEVSIYFFLWLKTA